MADTPAAPNISTMAACTNRYNASSPITEGVRMVLCDTVWNTTVDRPMAQATSAMVSTLAPRCSSTKAQSVLTPTVMKASRHSSASPPSSARRRPRPQLRADGSAQATDCGRLLMLGPCGGAG